MGINTGNEAPPPQKERIKSLFRHTAVTGFVVAAACVTWDLHAGVNGSGGLDGGRRVTPVHLVRLGVLGLAVDHREAQTQPLGKRLSPDAATPGRTVQKPRQQKTRHMRRYKAQRPATNV